MVSEVNFRSLANAEREYEMRVKYLVSILAILLAALTFFPLDTLADTESTSGSTGVILLTVIICIPVAIICFAILSMIKERIFLKAHRKLILSTDPKVLLELSKRCERYLRKDRRGDKVRDLADQAKHKMNKIQSEIDLETFKSEISEDGSHPAVVSILKKKMHNPDSFQHVSSDYEIVEQDGNHYHKIIMTFRATNTYNALVLQTCYFLIDADKQISLVGSPDSTESSPINTVSLADAADAAASAVEGAATLADLLVFFSSDEE